jgi:hypothetical protein
LPQERKPPILPTGTSKVVPPKDICSECAPQLSKLEERYSEELHKRHIQWKQFVQYVEDEGKEAIRKQQEVQQKMVEKQLLEQEEHAKKVKALEDEIKGWKQRFKTYEEFAVDFAKLTAPWGKNEGNGDVEMNAET